jgi:GT2 family glycosyltransferase
LGQSQILAVVVRYKTPIAESQTLQGLAHILAADPVLADVYRVLVWDNSPEALVNPELPRSFEYRHSEQNLGVSGAYNSAMAFAEAEGQTWMLLLDQDSKLTGAFLHTMYRHSQVLKDRTDIAVIFPTVKVGQTIMSPKRQLFMRATVYEPMSRMLEGYAIGINSGSVMRVTSLRKIGGFSTDFWLDYSDLYVLHQFHLNGARIWYAADAAMQHEMTIMDYDRLMEPWRYENFSFAETAFHDLYKGRLENGLHDLRLLARTIRQRLRYKNPVFSQIAWAQLLYRLRVPRKRRLARWKQQGQKRIGLNS